MRILLFIVCTIMSIILVAWPILLLTPTRENMAFGGAWFLVVGAANQFIQKKLENILNP